MMPEFRIAIDMSSELDGRLKELDISLEQLISEFGDDLRLAYGALVTDGAGSRSKNLVPIIIGTSVGLVGVITAITNLFNVYLHRPHYAEWDELEELIEDGKVVRDDSGNPIWKVKHRQGIVEPQAKRSIHSMDLSTTTTGVVVRFRASSGEQEPADSAEQNGLPRP